MTLPPIANVIDAEYDNKRLIEVGVTTVDIAKRQILKTYSLPVKIDFDLSPEISELTGWTTQRLIASGLDKAEITRRLDKYGCLNRLLVVDYNREIASIRREIPRAKMGRNILNVSILFTLMTGKPSNLGLEKMLAEYGMDFEGKLHRASVDSLNIARLFLALIIN